MRSGGYTFQQSLSPESASLVKQAIAFARRRGHAQVTPLHVASTMLASSTGLLKRACLKSNSHPLQCRALELCFNVALNRLPTCASSPLLASHSHLPSVSNALVAAFKRAQAQQRRGSVENQQQQQPVLALKVEAEQLVISILDDPSISRVMREAGFSSTQVKSNVEQAVSLEISTPQICTNPLASTPRLGSGLSIGRAKNSGKNDEVTRIFEALMSKKSRNAVIVSECSSRAERMVRQVIEKFCRKEVPAEMKSVQFISVPLSTLQDVTKQEFEVRLAELRSLVKAYENSGVVLYLGNLDWVSEFWCDHRDERKSSYSCRVEYMTMELSRLTNGPGEHRRMWIMGSADFKTYAKCKSGHPSLETLWGLCPLTVPDGTSLTLGLSLDRSDPVSKDESEWLLQRAGVEKLLACCSDCWVNFTRDARDLTTSGKVDSNMASWLYAYSNGNVKQLSIDQECKKMKDLCKKWNSICSSIHQPPHFLQKKFSFSSSSPSTSALSSNDQTLMNWPLIFQSETEVSKPVLANYFPDTKPDLLSNPNSSPNSASSSEASGDRIELENKFTELSSENLKILCRRLGKNVPWQRDILPEIATTVLKCRSGRSRSKITRKNRQDSWLLFLGPDSDGKEAVARELARTIFGSYDSFTSIQLSSFSEVSNSKKRGRDEDGSERFLERVGECGRRVLLVWGEMDGRWLKGLGEAMESGKFEGLRDGIVILCCERYGGSTAAAASSSSSSLDPIRGCSKSEEFGLLDLNVATEEEEEEEDSVVRNGGMLEWIVDGKFIFQTQLL